MWLLLSVIAIIGLICLYMINNYNYWKKRGLDTPKYYYIVGNLLEQFTFKKNIAVILQDNYKAFEGYNYIGFYNAMQPAIMIRNPEIVGDVLIKDFASFGDNDFDIDEDADPIFGKNPFILKGQRWKTARAHSTPSFTAGKIKMMMPLIKETSSKLLAYLKDNENTSVDAFVLANRITGENVASCAFGLEGGCFTKDNARFVDITNQLIKPTVWNILKGFMIFLCPPLARMIKVRYFQVETVEYLRDIVEQTMKYRRENGIQRNDFLDEMQRLKERINDEQQFNFLDILGHAGGFLLDGLLTSSCVVTYLLYELARNPEVQEKLREEVREHLQTHNELTYENIQEMAYLDCVFKENPRLNPPLMFMTRRVTKPYTMKSMREDGTGPKVELQVGTPVMIPLYALHMDEKYFPEPEKFDPTRWCPENKDNIVKNTYLPFSDGPRVCLGMRFGVLQIKMLLVTIINDYGLTPCARTMEPGQIDPTNFFNLPVGGHWIDFNKLN